MLKQRLLVAVVGVPLALLVIIWGGYAFLAFALFIALFGLHEYYTMIRPYRPNLLLGYVAGAGTLVAVYFAGLSGLAGGLAATLVLLVVWSLRAGPGDHLTGRMGVTAFGLVWVVMGTSYLVMLRALEHGVALLLLAVGVTWFNDTFAYAVGRLVGRHRLAPRISPNKTIEGAIGGLVGSVLFAIGVKIYNPEWLSLRDAVILGVAVGVAGQLGDLLESAVKRDLRVKDSGRILPGHGGVLDRFDSIFLAGVVTYWVAWLLLRQSVGGFPL
jgi:phosphatidate cytidylyltransferase